jgi:hypothetical protein
VWLIYFDGEVLEFIVFGGFLYKINLLQKLEKGAAC